MFKIYEENIISGEKFFNIPETETLKHFNTHEVWKVFEFIKKACKNDGKKYTLITHNSDWSVSMCMEGCGLLISDIPKNLHWFSQNVDIEHPNIESLPIGLENKEWHPYKNKKIINRINYEIKTCEYMCCAFFNPATNKRRKQIFEYYSQFDWCISKSTINGNNFDEYLDALNKSIFCICPEGNGIDTHRFWEALYMGCIPVVEDCINLKFYKDVPMLLCGNLLDLNQSDFVKQHYELIYNLGGWDYTVLDFDYWRNKILASAER